VIEIDMRAGAASIATQIQAALGPGFSVTNPSGSVLRVLDDGAAATTDVSALRITDPVLRLFTDNGPAAYTGSTTASAERTGFSSRITVNPEAMGDSRAFVAWTAGSPVADPTRPTRMADRFRTERFTFGSDTGLGSGSTAFTGTSGSFLRQVVTQRGAQAESASRVLEGQQIVMNNLAERRQDKSGVDIDTEMARLITIQNAYAANARVMTAVRDLFDILMRV
jgi:flagellar hook-associated protein 1 FlgK